MDKAASIAFNPSAPADEQFAANAEMQRAAMPRAMSDLMPSSEIQPVIDFILRDFEDQDMNKSLNKNVADFPSKNAKGNKQGMQSVYLDDLQISVMGDYFEKPGAFGFDMMRTMVDQTPILSAVIMTRIRQVSRFCQIQETGKGPGFEIRMKDKEAHVGSDEKQSIQMLQNFFLNSGWETSPRQRNRLKRDSFTGLVNKLTRDSLTMDSCAIETEWKRDKALGFDGIYAVDGSTIRLCTEEGYRGDDELFALQVVQGRIRSAYTYDDLIYVPRNPRTDVLSAGYGMSETELLIKVVTGFLNAFTHNTKYFDSNQIPRGLLHLTGNYGDQDLAAFRRYWSTMVRGVNNAHNLPFLVSKDQESKASFEQFGQPVDEMMFSKWMTFLTSIICAIYGIGPEEINFDAFSSAGSSPLAGSDTEQRLTHSKENGLRPLMSYFQGIFSDYVVSEFSDKYVFRWTGLDEEDEEKRHEIRKMVLTVNEMRAAEGYDKLVDQWGNAPLNPALLGAWQAEQQANSPQDFGDDDGEPSKDDQLPGEPQDPQQEDEKENGDKDGPPDPPAPATATGKGRNDPNVVAKAFGLPVMSLGT